MELTEQEQSDIRSALLCYLGATKRPNLLPATKERVHKLHRKMLNHSMGF